MAQMMAECPNLLGMLSELRVALRVILQLLDRMGSHKMA
jgi:hypothetical protein